MRFSQSEDAIAVGLGAVGQGSKLILRIPAEQFWGKLEVTVRWDRP